MASRKAYVIEAEFTRGGASENLCIILPDKAYTSNDKVIDEFDKIIKSLFGKDAERSMNGVFIKKGYLMYVVKTVRAIEYEKTIPNY